ncbi:MAG: hypothetical protein ABIZ34_09450 [Candidatus Limnocylindrales bacterium]
MVLDTTSPRSRRTLLGAALGAVAATVSAGLGRPDQARAVFRNPVILAESNHAEASTTIDTSVRDAFVGLTTDERGSGVGGFAEARVGATFGTFGRSRSDRGIGGFGWSAGNSTGLMGYASQGLLLPPPPVGSTGVYGFANTEGTNPRGVFGDSPWGIGVSGASVHGSGVHGHSDIGTGVRGVSRDDTGVGGSGPNSGVRGESLTGIGVFGYTDTGIGMLGRSRGGAGIKGESISSHGVDGSSHESDAVYGFSSARSGVRGVSFSRNHTGAGVTGSGSTGVLGFTGDPRSVPRGPANTGVYGVARGIDGRGGEFSGAAAQIKLRPSKAKEHPASGAMGDFFVDANGALWFCKGDTVWTQLA